MFTRSYPKHLLSRSIILSLITSLFSFSLPYGRTIFLFFFLFFLVCSLLLVLSFLPLLFLLLIYDRYLYFLITRKFSVDKTFVLNFHLISISFLFVAISRLPYNACVFFFLFSLQSTFQNFLPSYSLSIKLLLFTLLLSIYLPGRDSCFVATLARRCPTHRKDRIVQQMNTLTFTVS